VFAATAATLATAGIEAAAALGNGTGRGRKGENSVHSWEAAAAASTWVAAAAAAAAAEAVTAAAVAAAAASAERAVETVLAAIAAMATTVATAAAAAINKGKEREKKRGRDRGRCQWVAASDKTWAAIAAGITEAEAGITTAAEAVTVPTAPPAGKYTRQLGQHYLTSTETTVNRQTSEKMLDQHYMMSTETTANRHIFNRQQLYTGWSIASHTAGSICLPRKPCTKRQTTNQAASGALWHTLLPLDTSCPHPTHTPHTTKQHPAPPLDPFLLPEPFSSVQAPALHP